MDDREVAEPAQLKLIVGAASETNSPAFIVAELQDMLRADAMESVAVIVRDKLGNCRVLWSHGDGDRSVMMGDVLHAAIRKGVFGL